MVKDVFAPKQIDQGSVLRSVGRLFFALALGCGANGHTESKAPTPALSPVAEPSSMVLASGQPVASHDPEVSTVVGAEAKGPFQVRLPADAQSVGALLPGPNPGRYAHWHQVGTIRVGKSYLQQADLLSDGRLVLVKSTMESLVRVYNRSSRALLSVVPIANLPHPGTDTSVVAWPDPSQPSFIAGSGDGLWLHDATGNTPATELDKVAITALRWAPDRRILAAAYSETAPQRSQMFFYRRTGAQHLTRLGTIHFPQRVDGWDLSVDNRLLAVTTYPSNTLDLIDLHDGRVLWSIPAPEYSRDVSISPDGRTLAAGGDALLLVDLKNPDRRAVVTGFENNIDSVRYSPSGDAIVTTSYDGKVRVFGYEMEGPRLHLEKILRHKGTASVHAIRFFDEGNGLLTSSGDGSIRLWGSGHPSGAGTALGNRFEPLGDAEIAAMRARREEISLGRQPLRSTFEERRDQLAEIYATPRHRPAMLDGPPRPARIRPGEYACRVSKGYKMRDCVVETDAAGHVMLEVKEGNLIAMKGVLFDDGSVVRFEGWPIDRRPFRCFSCQERCFLQPGTCGCQPRPPERIVSCLKQPLHGVFRGQGNTWNGVVLYNSYHDEKLPAPLLPDSIPLEDASDRFSVTLRRR